MFIQIEVVKIHTGNIDVDFLDFDMVGNTFISEFFHDVGKNKTIVKFIVVFVKIKFCSTHHQNLEEYPLV